ncbi:MAG: orotate phosphoribosyltransferase, partial [Gemmatimonadales bacterium]|nr:orotate phosphoribosyltransferase [Gemmatimonadales bacterium]
MSDRSRLIELLLERSIQHGDFLLASGRHSTHYIDARRTTMSAEGLALVGRLGLSAIRDAGWFPDAIGGLTLGADPVAYAIAAASSIDPPTIDAFTIRKEPKKHGAGRQVEGNLERGHRVVVVEDVITTGNSARRAIAVVEEAGASVLGVLGVVDRLGGGRESLEADGRTVVVVTTSNDLG